MGDAEIGRFQAAAEKGLAWILAQQRPDGSFCDVADGIGAYYKAPYVLSQAGREREAQRLMQWVEAHHVTPEGDFRGPERKANFPIFEEGWPVYGNAWLILGAQRLGRWGTAHRGMDLLCRYQTPIGGFYALDEGKPYLECVCTAWGGMAALATGRMAQARLAGDALVRLVEQQPNPSRFYFRMTVDGRLVTDVPPKMETFYFVDATRPKQIYYHPGISLILLANLYRATGEARYRQACETILAFCERCADDVYAYPPSGKLGMGCALLYSITGNETARQGAIKVADYFTRTQTEEGWWVLPRDSEVYAAVPDTFDVQFDIACEIVGWLLGIVSLI